MLVDWLDAICDADGGAHRAPTAPAVPRRRVDERRCSRSTPSASPTRAASASCGAPRRLARRRSAATSSAIYGQRRAGKTTLLRVAAGLRAARRRHRRVRRPRPRALVAPRARARLHRDADRLGLADRAAERAGCRCSTTSRSRCFRTRSHAQARSGGARGARARRRADDGGERALARAVGRRARTLVALAHALVREPRLLLADEPTADLNMIEREQILGLLRSVAEEAGVASLMAVPDVPTCCTPTPAGARAAGASSTPRRRSRARHGDRVPRRGERGGRSCSRCASSRQALPAPAAGERRARGRRRLADGRARRAGRALRPERVGEVDAAVPSPPGCCAPDSGAVRFDGRDLTALSRARGGPLPAPRARLRLPVARPAARACRRSTTRR